MLGALRAILPGAAFAQSSATMVSLWAFDETTGAGGVFDDLGPADVPMTMVGSWTDLTTGSIVQGVGGTSAYTNGTAYATIAANDPAHDLSALTISFYYQRNAAAAKQVLLAAGDGAQAGDFSIEVLADGKLRGYHIGQDGELRFFEGTNGITGTNLQVGTAHRIDLALGQQGARIYLDGAELAAAAIPANRNSWNNARVKYLGRWTDGIQAPADGAFDRFRIWNWQLSNVEIAGLEPAQSIVLPGALTGSEPLVPSTAEFLANDDMPIPGGTVRYAEAGGSGTGGSTEGSAGALQTTLTASSSGQTVVALGGFYDITGGITIPAGVTLMAKPGAAVVISRCEEFAAARAPNTGFWTQSGLSQADIDKKIWRSTSRVGAAGANSTLRGVWVESDQPHYLCPYPSMTALRASYASGDSPATYAGPGARMEDGFVYVRMQKPHPTKYGFGSPWAAHKIPWGKDNPNCVASGKLNYPITENPNSYVLHLERDNSNTALAYGSGATIGSGINSVGFKNAIGNTGNITVRRGTHISWRNFLAPYGNVTRTVWKLHRVRSTCGATRHLARGEFKFGGWLEGVRPTFWELTSGAKSKQIIWENCTILGWHEWMLLGTEPDMQFRIRNCTFVDILDDGWQGKATTTRVEIAYNYFLAAALGGLNQDDENSSDGLGHYWVHHNILDARFIKMHDWGSQQTPLGLWLNHSQSANEPRKNYNNTILYGPDNEDSQSNGLPHGDGRLNTSTQWHEVFNNIVVRQDDRRYTDSESLSADANECIQDKMKPIERWSNSKEKWDYNLYYKDLPVVTGAAFCVYAGSSNGGRQVYASLANLRATYEEFESHGVQADPGMGAVTDWTTSSRDYRPGTANTAGTSGSLTGENWWSTPPTWGTAISWSGLAPSPWKGALDPNGSTVPVGVQNP